MDFEDYVTQNKGYNDDDTINDIAELMTIAWNAALDKASEKVIELEGSITGNIIKSELDNLKK